MGQRTKQTFIQSLQESAAITKYSMEILLRTMGFPGGTSGKEVACLAGDARDTGWIPGL